LGRGRNLRATANGIGFGNVFPYMGFRGPSACAGMKCARIDVDEFWADLDEFFWANVANS
jgi:hypothetical protein